MQLPLPAGSFKHPSQPTNHQTCVNYFPSAIGPQGRGAVTLLPTAGCRLLADGGSGELRFMENINGDIYTVIGDSFYKLIINEYLGTGTLELIGLLNTDTGTVKGTNNPNQIMLVDGLYGYIYNYIYAGTVALGIIGGTVGDTYTLTINGVSIYSAQNVAAGLDPNVLVTTINLHSATAGVVATYQSGLFTLTANDGITSITVAESGTGFTAGSDGITVSPGIFDGGLSFQQFQEITDADFRGGTHVLYIDGYFIYNEPNSQNFWFSEPNEGRIWNGINVAAAASKPDYLVALGETKSEMWAFGSESIEVWYDAANPVGSPFSKRVGSDIDIGCAAPYSVTNVNDLLVWIDSRGFVVQSDVSPLFRDQSSGYTLTKISDEALDAELSTYFTLGDAIGTTYVDRGHLMYELTFPTAKKTWVYDFNTKAWHEHLTVETELGELEHSLSQYCDTLNNDIICGGIRDGKIYILSPEYFYDGDNIITRICSTFFVQNDFKEVGVDGLELKLATGMAGLTDPNGQVMMQFSNDGCYTWSWELMRPIGKHGEYNKRIIWNMLGTANQWAWKFKITAPFKHAIVDLTINTNSEA